MHRALDHGHTRVRVQHVAPTAAAQYSINTRSSRNSRSDNSAVRLPSPARCVLPGAWTTSAGITPGPNKKPGRDYYQSILAHRASSLLLGADNRGSGFGRGQTLVVLRPRPSCLRRLRPWQLVVHVHCSRDHATATLLRGRRPTLGAGGLGSGLPIHFQAHCSREYEKTGLWADTTCSPDASFRSMAHQ